LPTPRPTLDPGHGRPYEHASGMVAIPNQRYLRMWKHPGRGEPAYAFDARNPNRLGGRRSPLLIDGRAERGGKRWVKVLLPIRPNGASGWAKVSDVRLKPVFERIVVDLSARALRHYVREDLVDRFRVGIGTPQYPTGQGRFYVWQRVAFADASGPYGIFALGLSGFSPVLSEWPGEGRMAIHGTADPSDRGRDVSHGCVRVYNADMRALTRVRLGTPVVIRA
jgi:L,D-transpeptidase catalytic domain